MRAVLFLPIFYRARRLLQQLPHIRIDHSYPVCLYYTDHTAMSVPAPSQMGLNGMNTRALNQGPGSMTTQQNYTAAALGKFGVMGAKTTNSFFGHNTDNNSGTTETNAPLTVNCRQITQPTDNKNEELMHGDVVFSQTTYRTASGGPVPTPTSQQIASDSRGGSYKTITQVNRILSTFRKDYQTAEQVTREFKLHSIVGLKGPPTLDERSQTGFGFAGILSGFVPNSPNLWFKFRPRPGDKLAYDLIRVTDPKSRFSRKRGADPMEDTDMVSAENKDAKTDAKPVAAGSGGSKNKVTQAPPKRMKGNDGNPISRKDQDPVSRLLNKLISIQNVKVPKQIYESNEAVQNLVLPKMAEEYPTYWKFVPRVLSPSGGTSNMPIPGSAVDGWSGRRFVIGTVFNTRGPSEACADIDDVIDKIISPAIGTGDAYIDAYKKIGTIDILMKRVRMQL